MATSAVKVGRKHQRHRRQARRIERRDRQGHQGHHLHRPADEPAGLERHDRGGTRRRGGQGLCGGRQRGQGTGQGDRQGDRGHQPEDRGDPGRHQGSRGGHRPDQHDHQPNQRHLQHASPAPSRNKRPPPTRLAAMWPKPRRGRRKSLRTSRRWRRLPGARRKAPAAARRRLRSLHAWRRSFKEWLASSMLARAKAMPRANRRAKVGKSPWPPLGGSGKKDKVVSVHESDFRPDLRTSLSRSLGRDSGKGGRA